MNDTRFRQIQRLLKDKLSKNYLIGMLLVQLLFIVGGVLWIIDGYFLLGSGVVLFFLWTSFFHLKLLFSEDEVNDLD